MIVDPLGSRYPTPAANLQFYRAVEREVASTAGVRSVGWASTLPMGPSYEGNTFFDIVGRPFPRDSQRPTADYQIVSPGYFTTVDLPVVDGRAFTEHDRSDTVPVCIVNEAFVRTYLHDRSPIGARVAIRASAAADAQSTVREVVGVAKQVKSRPDEREELLQIYVPLAQDTVGDMFMVVTPIEGRAGALAPSVRAAIGRVDTEQLVSVRDVMTLDEVARDATSRYRFRAVLVAAFATLALVLAMIGVFGILAYTVQQRLREFGVRRALGATAGDVWRLVAGSAFRLVGVGVGLGLLVAAISGRLLATMLFGVEPLDPFTFGTVLALLGMTALAAVTAPAWRATRVDPVVALRND
jgi:putative ABC transport system permease protein